MNARVILNPRHTPIAFMETLLRGATTMADIRELCDVKGCVLECEADIMEGAGAVAGYATQSKTNLNECVWRSGSDKNTYEVIFRGELS